MSQPKSDHSNSSNTNKVLVKVTNLVKHFPKRGGLLNQVIAKVHAVNDVSFEIRKGETLGVVGESGCGKSTLGKTLIRLHDPTSGRVVFDGTNITHLSRSRLRPIRRRMQMIFQDPNSSLNPRMTVEVALREVIRLHKIVPENEMRSYIDSLLTKVGLRIDDRGKYPHEFSGGQKVLNLLMDLKNELQLTLLFVSHDLKVIDHFCDRMLVMYLGNVVEELPCQDIHATAKHPYTKALLASNPITDPDQRGELVVLEGEVPSPYNPPAGCPFITRCPIATDRCKTENPPLEDHGDGHRVACWEVKK